MKAPVQRIRRLQRGAVLPLVAGLLVVMVILGSGLIAGAGTSRVEAVRRKQSGQCFWMAESALAIARWHLRDESYRQVPVPVQLTSGYYRGWATVTVSGRVYTITAVGSDTVSRLSRKVQQRFEVRELDYWDDFALFVGANGADLAQSITIAGDVFSAGDIRMSQAAAILESLYCLGDLSMSQSAVIYDEAYVGGSIKLSQSSVIYGGAYPFDSPANPYYIVQPTVPAIDWAWYQSLLALAAVQDSGLDFNNDINLAGQVKFVRGSASLKSYKRIYSNPPGGVLVVRDTLQIQQNSRIESDVSVICGDMFWMGQNTRVASNCLIYAGTTIDMKQSGIVVDRCSLITPGTIDMKQAAQASGFIYAGTLLTLSQSTAIRGLAFSGQRADLSQGVAIYYDPACLPSGLPPGFSPTNAVIVTPYQWREL